LDMDRKNIDGISYLGELLQSTDPNVLSLVQIFISKNLISPGNPFTSTEAAALGQLLCGLQEEQWRDFITPKVFASILTEHLSKLDCRVTPSISQLLSSRLIALYGPVASWTTADVLSIGWLASTLTPEQLAQLQPHVIEGLTGLAVKYFSSEQLGNLSYSQMSQMSPHAASFISREQVIPLTSVSKRRGIRAAVGEDERLTKVVGEAEEDLNDEEGRDGKAEVELTTALPSDEGVDIDVNTETGDTTVKEEGSLSSESAIEEDDHHTTGGTSASLPSFSVVVLPLMLLKILGH